MKAFNTIKFFSFAILFLASLTAGGAQLKSGGTLRSGDSITSANGQFQLTFTRGRPELSKGGGPRPLWSTFDKTGSYLSMQTDGNLVLIQNYVNTEGKETGWKATWSSGTANNPGAILEVTDDGKLVIKKPDGSVIWDAFEARKKEVQAMEAKRR